MLLQLRPSVRSRLTRGLPKNNRIACVLLSQTHYARSLEYKLRFASFGVHTNGHISSLSASDPPCLLKATKSVNGIKSMLINGRVFRYLLKDCEDILSERDQNGRHQHQHLDVFSLHGESTKMFLDPEQKIKTAGCLTFTHSNPIGTCGTTWFISGPTPIVSNIWFLGPCIRDVRAAWLEVIRLLTEAVAKKDLEGDIHPPVSNFIHFWRSREAAKKLWHTYQEDK